MQDAFLSLDRSRAAGCFFKASNRSRARKGRENESVITSGSILLDNAMNETALCVKDLYVKTKECDFHLEESRRPLVAMRWSEVNIVRLTFQRAHSAAL